MNTVHEILVAGVDFTTCRERTLRFFGRHLLVRYHEVRIEEGDACAASASEFWERIEAGAAVNQNRAAAIVAELQAADIDSLTALATLEQGYRSKLLHTLAHLLDGFFGIDSYFYNLIDDSHAVSTARRRQIEGRPDSYWLLRATGRTESGEDSLAGLRRLTNNR